MSSTTHTDVPDSASAAGGAWRPSAFGAISLIVRRELGFFFRSRIGYLIGSLILLIDGMLYNVFAIGGSARYSTEVLSDFFFFSSGIVMAAAMVVSMRLIAEERQSGSLPLLTTSSLSDGEIIFAKFLS